MPINIVGGYGLSFWGCDVTFDHCFHSKLSKVPRSDGDDEFLFLLVIGPTQNWSNYSYCCIRGHKIGLQTSRGRETRFEVPYYA